MSDLYFQKNGDVIKAISDGTNKAVEKLAILIAAQAKVLAPVKSGHLKQSIGWKSTTDQSNDFTTKVNEHSAIVGVPSNVEYAVYVELGTRFRSPKPYLRPAIAYYTTAQTAIDLIKKTNEEELLGTLKQTAPSERIRFY